jgi:hypothetical protein
MSLPKKSAADYFQWPSGIVLQIQSVQLPKPLQRELGVFRNTAGNDLTADARIVFCQHAKELPSTGEVWSGRYKGMPWRIVRDHTADGVSRFFFHAPFFRTFLFIRTCLIPILKKITIERGGFFLIGSAWAYKGTAFILFGNPGSGKTRLLLDRLDAGGEFLGDSELILTGEKKVFPVFPYLEARLKTLYGTAHWARLSLKNKVYLWFCHMLSFVSGGRISFNLLLDSADNPAVRRSSATGSFSRYFVLRLSQDRAETAALPLADFLTAVESYETDYQQTFGASLYTPELRSLGLKQLKNILSGAALWTAAAGPTARDFLAREMKA